MIGTLMTRYYPQIDVCQSEKDGDIAAKKKELELAAEEDFGNTRVTIFLFFPNQSICRPILPFFLQFGQWRSWAWNTLEYPWTSK